MGAWEELLLNNFSEFRTLAAQMPDFGLIVFASLLFLSSVIGLPPPGLVTLAGAALFGFFPAFLVSLFIVVLGAMVPFYLSRQFIGPWIARKYPLQTNRMRDGLHRDGPWYLFSLRLLPMVPFPIVNLIMGVTTISPVIFASVSIVGRIPLTILYCNAGIQLATIQSRAEIFTPQVIISLSAIALAPHFFRLVLRHRIIPYEKNAQNRPTKLKMP